MRMGGSIRTRQDATLEHLIPKSRGGIDEMENLAATCRRCNSLKGPLTENEFWAVRNDSKALKYLVRVVSGLIEGYATGEEVFQHEVSLQLLVENRTLTTTVKPRVSTRTPQVPAQSGVAKLRAQLIKAGLINVDIEAVFPEG